MTVYLIRNKTTFNIKVGFTNGNPLNRLRDLQVGACGELELLMTYKGKLSDEQTIHHKCCHLGMKIRGEWFTSRCIEVCRDYFYPQKPTMHTSSMPEIKKNLDVLSYLEEEKQGLIRDKMLLNAEIKKLQEENKKLLYANKELSDELSDNQTIMKNYRKDIEYWRNTTRLLTDANIETKRNNDVAIIPIVEKTKKHSRKYKTVQQTA